MYFCEGCIEIKVNYGRLHLGKKIMFHSNRWVPWQCVAQEKKLQGRMHWEPGVYSTHEPAAAYALPERVCFAVRMCAWTAVFRLIAEAIVDSFLQSEYICSEREGEALMYAV